MINSLPVELQEQIVKVTFDIPMLEIELNSSDDFYKNYCIFRLADGKFVMKKVVKRGEVTSESLFNIINPLEMARSILITQISNLNFICVSGKGLEKYYVSKRGGLVMEKAIEAVQSYIAAAWGLGALKL